MIWDSENDRGSDCVLKATFSSPSGFRNRQNMARIGCELAITTIALVLLAAAALKINSLSTRAAMGITGAKSGLELAAVLGEVLLATWLISGFARNWARASGVLLFAVFSIISLKHWIAGDLNCGCFGEVTVHPAWTTGFDIVAVLTLIKFGRRPIRDDGNVNPSVNHRLFRILGAGCVSGSLIAAAMLLPTFLGKQRDAVIFEPDLWQKEGKLELLEFVDKAAHSDLITGKRIVVIFDHNCPHCLNYIARLRHNEPDHDQIRLIDIASDEWPSRSEVSSLGLGPRHIELRKGVTYAAVVPVKVILNEGRVEDVQYP